MTMNKYPEGTYICIIDTHINYLIFVIDILHIIIIYTFQTKIIFTYQWFGAKKKKKILKVIISPNDVIL